MQAYQNLQLISRAFEKAVQMPMQCRSLPIEQKSRSIYNIKGILSKPSEGGRRGKDLLIK
jgi:hypothetical protein